MVILSKKSSAVSYFGNIFCNYCNFGLKTGFVRAIIKDDLMSIFMYINRNC